jgi:hypothetical protein
MRCQVEYVAPKAEDVGLPNEYERHPVIVNDRDLSRLSVETSSG